MQRDNTLCERHPYSMPLRNLMVTTDEWLVAGSSFFVTYSIPHLRCKDSDFSDTLQIFCHFFIKNRDRIVGISPDPGRDAGGVVVIYARKLYFSISLFLYLVYPPVCVVPIQR